MELLRSSSILHKSEGRAKKISRRIGPGFWEKEGYSKNDFRCLAWETARMVFSLPEIGKSNLGWKIRSSGLDMSCLKRLGFSFCLHGVSYELICGFEPKLHTQNKSQLVTLYDLFNVLQNLVYYHFVEDFCIYVYQGYQSIVFFFCDVFFWFWNQCNNGLV